jgi:hypothetical protein
VPAHRRAAAPGGRPPGVLLLAAGRALRQAAGN